MPNYKRARYGNTYFFTVVTYQRNKILCLEPCIAALRCVYKMVSTSHPFTTDAIVVLPDHLHCIWTLADGDTNYSMRWSMIKREFTKRVKDLVRMAHPTLNNNPSNDNNNLGFRLALP